MRVATASDYGSQASLFLRGARTLGGGPVPPGTWPFDDARHVDSLAELGPIVGELAAGDRALVAVLVLDVDRAGHADGVGAHYRAEAAAVDRMLSRYGETVATMRKVLLPDNVKVTDIVSDKPLIPPPNEEIGPGSAAWLRVHQEFDRAAPNCRGVIAKGSGHYIMRDRPDLVVDEIAAMFRSTQ